MVVTGNCKEHNLLPEHLFYCMCLENEDACCEMKLRTVFILLLL